MSVRVSTTASVQLAVSMLPWLGGGPSTGTQTSKSTCIKEVELRLTYMSWMTTQESCPSSSVCASAFCRLARTAASATATVALLTTTVNLPSTIQLAWPSFEIVVELLVVDVVVVLPSIISFWMCTSIFAMATAPMPDAQVSMTQTLNQADPSSNSFLHAFKAAL